MRACRAAPFRGAEPCGRFSGAAGRRAGRRRSSRGPLCLPKAGTGPREDRRGSSRRSAALFRPAGFGWGRARECGTRQTTASPTPPPIRAQATPSLTRVVQIRLTADFQRRLSVRAFPGHFSGSFQRFGGYKCPPRLHFTQKMASKGAARPPATRPEPRATRETRGHLLFGVLLPGADS